MIGALATRTRNKLSAAVALNGLAADAVLVRRAVDEIGLRRTDGAAALTALGDMEDVVAHDCDVERFVTF
ncbi:hypothetical protein BDP55DRAFT_649459 [Colletotrichum godetiae]|uniref:Uncharacterized protein n=1 Tax=Colletotrichum godetiae TaxID=1209918 RepID=A0AAJ0F303_9PEZI|nr:uncharacterized protein BDP55DRAFT_649459 [Colletotrichum godetiae]KAK1691048.1 hypothetical protein BDP55DRAFT_649459 [Colletotrichum godetiae]